ncbi:MAG TPA: methyltransferase domain-containing protein, partial [Nocardioidaceae bacterium]|nr:methyltransferase domain-containing protein [Nocardioidaceae bacterium]
MARWNPTTYLQFADERSRPFVELVARIDRPSPRSVVDLGCGPGQITAMLADRWPDASVLGLDSSADMIETAHEHDRERLRFELADLRSWTAADPVDVIVSNAALQWVPGHRELLPRL